MPKLKLRLRKHKTKRNNYLASNHARKILRGGASMGYRYSTTKIAANNLSNLPRL